MMRFIIRAICSIPVCAYGSHIITASVSTSTTTTNIMLRVISMVVVTIAVATSLTFLVVTIIVISIIPFYRIKRASAPRWIAFWSNAIIAASKLCFSALLFAVHYLAWIKSKNKEQNSGNVCHQNKRDKYDKPRNNRHTCCTYCIENNSEYNHYNKFK